MTIMPAPILSTERKPSTDTASLLSMYVLADGLPTAIGCYDDLPVSYATLGTSIQSYSLSYDYIPRNITRRSDHLRNFLEDFTYDNLDWLTNATVTGYSSATVLRFLNSGERLVTNAKPPENKRLHVLIKTPGLSEQYFKKKRPGNRALCVLKFYFF